MKDIDLMAYMLKGAIMKLPAALQIGIDTDMADLTNIAKALFQSESD
ncbi:MAG: hypothetical protein KJ899_00900 [Gammaproteobacteria bacterium]|nr:hypothetical protein [Gammaproteobacteria bacterium]